MSTVLKFVSRFLANCFASLLLWSLENLEGIEIKDTFSEPRASTARQATNAESIPPLSPITAFSCPVLMK